MWEDIRLEISPKTAVVGVLQLGVPVVVMICAALGITIHDHLVIGRKGHASFRSLGLLS